VFTEEQAIQPEHHAAFKSHTLQAAIAEASRLREPNTLDELSRNKSIYDRFKPFSPIFQLG
jgi:hypothetical protein